jgi:hypothetical protein
VLNFFFTQFECFSLSHLRKVFKLLFHAVIGIHSIKHTAHDTFLIHCLSLPFFLSIKLSLTLSTGMAFITFSHNSFFYYISFTDEIGFAVGRGLLALLFFRTRVLLTFISFDVILHWKVKSLLWGDLSKAHSAEKYLFLCLASQSLLFRWGHLPLKAALEGGNSPIQFPASLISSFSECPRPSCTPEREKSFRKHYFQSNPTRKLLKLIFLPML